MHLFVVSLHILLCLFMIAIILLQPAKGEMGVALGGGGGGMFGPRGPTSILQRATTVVAVMFMGTSIVLALQSDPSRQTDGNAESQREELLREAKERKDAEATADPGAP